MYEEEQFTGCDICIVEMGELLVADWLYIYTCQKGWQCVKFLGEKHYVILEWPLVSALLMREN